jgi:hypothetical protein
MSVRKATALADSAGEERTATVIGIVIGAAAC